MVLFGILAQFSQPLHQPVVSLPTLEVCTWLHIFPRFSLVVCLLTLNLDTCLHVFPLSWPFSRAFILMHGCMFSRPFLRLSVSLRVTLIVFACFPALFSGACFPAVYIGIWLYFSLQAAWYFLPYKLFICRRLKNIFCGRNRTFSYDCPYVFSAW